MKDTIQAKVGYHITAVVNIITGEKGFRIDDGYQPLFVAKKRSYAGYKDEKEQNEMFHICEIFTDDNGIQYIYWRDEEINQDYITRVNAETEN